MLFAVNDAVLSPDDTAMSVPELVRLPLSDNGELEKLAIAVTPSGITSEVAWSEKLGPKAKLPPIALPDAPSRSDCLPVVTIWYAAKSWPAVTAILLVSVRFCVPFVMFVEVRLVVDSRFETVWSATFELKSI